MPTAASRADKIIVSDVRAALASAADPDKAIGMQARTLEILELGADGRFSVALSAAEGVHVVPGCAGLELDLGALWASIEALPAWE